MGARHSMDKGLEKRVFVRIHKASDHNNEVKKHKRSESQNENYNDDPPTFEAAYKQYMAKRTNNDQQDIIKLHEQQLKNSSLLIQKQKNEKHDKLPEKCNGVAQEKKKSPNQVLDLKRVCELVNKFEGSPNKLNIATKGGDNCKKRKSGQLRNMKELLQIEMGPLKQRRRVSSCACAEDLLKMQNTYRRQSELVNLQNVACILNGNTGAALQSLVNKKASLDKLKKNLVENETKGDKLPITQNDNNGNPEDILTKTLMKKKIVVSLNSHQETLLNANKMKKVRVFLGGK